jgi:hypothetical protein
MSVCMGSRCGHLIKESHNVPHVGYSRRGTTYSVHLAPRVPVEKLSTNRTVFCSKETGAQPQRRLWTKDRAVSGMLCKARMWSG